ncbi:MAG TPA: hypothetical protein VE596_14175 [Gaiellaceae bacterium]|jgi:hypothetical protein|nr:hypothetical protein [Gaiellaceae bacterium]
MTTEALYEPARFEPLIDEPWDPERVEDKIAAIVSDAEAAFDWEWLWSAQYWDEYREAQPAKVLYSGAAGVIWALDALRRRVWVPKTRITEPARSEGRGLSG